MSSAVKSKHGTWGRALGSLSVSILVVLGFRWVLLEPYVIPSGSMIPTLLELDYIYVNKFAYGLRLPFSSNWLFYRNLPAQCDVVVFRSQTAPGQFLIKRVIGRPGDQVELLQSGRVRLNGKALPTELVGEAEGAKILRETCLDGTSHLIRIESHNDAIRETDADPVIFSTAVAEDSVIVFGDNRHQSADSRVWGALPRSELLGKALGIWLSCEQTLPEMSRICDPRELRIERIFKSLN